MTKQVMLADVVPILVTPFTSEGAIHEDDFRAQIRLLVEQGVQWSAFGYGSEVQRLSQEELVQLASWAVDEANGRMRFIGNVELTDPKQAARQAGAAAELGLAGVMVRPFLWPGVGEPTYADAFEALADSTPIPIVIQDAVQHTGVDLAPKSLARLGAHDQVAAVKVEPLGAAVKIGAVRDAALELGVSSRVAILGGAQGIAYLHELRRGANGTMPGPAFPEVFQALYRMHQAGKRDAAFQLMSQILPLIVLSNRNIETFILGQKEVLRRRGVTADAFLRQPHRAMDDLLFSEIEEVLAAIDFEAVLTASQAYRDASSYEEEEQA